ncbi:MAG: biotin/lipoyl-binding protein, partial [Caldithrix sp.]|nr:biotin/lipoyl-binding protein [Caldithrix sp.]
SPVHRPQTLDPQNAIKAPLPGMILKIMVKEGDVIERGQPIMMLEAMKMENEVNATAAGMIIDIKFKEGDSVNQGDVLLLLKPAEA